MADVSAKFIRISEAMLDDYPIVNGQLIITRTNSYFGSLFFDYNDVRHAIRDVYTIDDGVVPTPTANNQGKLFYGLMSSDSKYHLYANPSGNTMVDILLNGPDPELGLDDVLRVNQTGGRNLIIHQDGASDWVLRSGVPSMAWRSICYGNGLFVAVANTAGTNQVMTSPDGLNWTPRVSAANQDWISVCYGDGLFVAVSYTGSGTRAMTSPDGITWTLRNTPDNHNWQSVCYGNGTYVAVALSSSSNSTMWSTDGITWESGASVAGYAWTSVCYGDGVFVAVANSGTGNRVMTSTDGRTWTSRVSAADNNWRSVCYGNGLFVAVAASGSGNRVMTSPDGITWTARASAANNDWYSVGYGDGVFVAVACSGSGNRIMTSYDGISWSTQKSPANNNWFTVCYAQGFYVALSLDGAGSQLMTAPCTCALAMNLAGGFLDSGAPVLSANPDRSLSVAESATMRKKLQVCGTRFIPLSLSSAHWVYMPDGTFQYTANLQDLTDMDSILSIRVDFSDDAAESEQQAQAWRNVRWVIPTDRTPSDLVFISDVEITTTLPILVCVIN